MSCDYCLLCGHADIWHVMSGACFCEFLEEDSSDGLIFTKKFCWCKDFTTDWRKAQELYQTKYKKELEK